MSEVISDNRCSSNGTILYIGGFELPDKNAAAHRVIANAKLFKELGYESILVGVNKEIGSINDILDTRSLVEEFVTYSVPYPRRLMQWVNYISDASNYIQIAATTGDLAAIICYNFQSIALAKIKKYCEKNNIKCIADVTEWYTGLGRSFPIRIAKGFDTFYRMRLLQKRLDGLIVISRYLEDYYKKCKNVVYIPPLTDIKDEKWKSNYNKSKTTLKLVYAGNPGVKDKIDLLISALRFVSRKVQVDIVGIEKEAYQELHPEHKNFLEGCMNITFHGRLSHSDSLRYIKQANYSCFFRFQDRVTMAGFPTKFAEAISCGTPVITNKSSNIADYISENENGYLLNELSDKKIARVIENIDFAMKVDQKLFDYHNFVQQMSKLFD